MKAKFGIALFIMALAFGFAVAQNSTTSATMGTTAGANPPAAGARAVVPSTNTMVNTNTGTNTQNGIASSRMGTVATNNTVATNGVNNFSNTTPVNVPSQLPGSGVNGLVQNFNTPNTQLPNNGVNKTNPLFGNQVNPFLSPFGTNPTNPFLSPTTSLNPFANPFNTGIVSMNPSLANQVLTAELIAASQNPNFPLNVPPTQNSLQNTTVSLNQTNPVVLQRNNLTSRTANNSAGRTVNGSHPVSMGVGSGTRFPALTLGSTASGLSATNMIQSPSGAGSPGNDSQGRLQPRTVRLLPRIVQRTDGTFTNVQR